MAKTFICLANSYKLKHRCVAGKEYAEGIIGPWIRPVSNNSGQEVTLAQMEYQSLKTPSLLDIITIETHKPAPKFHQQENHIFNNEYYWTKRGIFPSENLELLVDDIDTLWTNGYDSYNGVNDRIPTNQAHNLRTSLLFISAENLVIKIAKEYNDKRKTRASFTHNGSHYTMVITDPVSLKETSNFAEGDYPQDGEYYLTISLAEDYKGFCYKVIAAIIQAPGEE